MLTVVQVRAIHFPQVRQKKKKTLPNDASSSAEHQVGDYRKGASQITRKLDALLSCPAQEEEEWEKGKTMRTKRKTRKKRKVKG